MAAVTSSAGANAPDPGGIERPIARRMPAIMIGAVGVLGITWWMAAQPPPGPGWNDPNGPQQQYPPGQVPPHPYPPPPPPPTQSSFCSACASADCANCMSGLDCGDCVNAIECADCMSGLDCGDCAGCVDCGTCAVAGSASASTATPAAAASGKSCSVRGWKRLAHSSGLLLPLFVLIGWRRRLRR